MKRISKMVILIMLLQCLCLPDYNYLESWTVSNLKTITDNELSKLSDDEIKSIIISSDDYTETVVGKIRTNETSEGNVDRRIYNLELNVSVYRKYKKIVYGKPFNYQRDYPGKKIQGQETKYLGFNNLGNPVTNDKYPGNSRGIEPPDKVWNYYSNRY
jgi:hypothetical protein